MLGPTWALGLAAFAIGGTLLQFHSVARGPQLGAGVRGDGTHLAAAVATAMWLTAAAVVAAFGSGSVPAAFESVVAVAVVAVLALFAGVTAELVEW